MSAFVASLAAQIPSTAASAAVQAADDEADVKGIKVKEVTGPARPEWTADARELTEADLPEDPEEAAGVAVVDLSASVAAKSTGSAGATSKPVRAGALPVTVAAPDAPETSAAAARVSPVQKVRVEVLSRSAAQAAGAAGLVLQLSRADKVAAAAPVTVAVDYRSVAGDFSPDAMSRLHLVRLSDGQAVPTQNNVTTGTLSATVSLAANSAATRFAVAAAAEGDNGDYKATSLSSASTWQVSQQTGAFSWSYPLQAPEPAGGPAPSLALSYSSGSIDGRTSGNNTQGSWVGDGWDLWPGYIERSYRACTDDHDEKEKKDPNNKDETGGDLCYFNDNATMSFNGSATELVKDASTDSGAGDKNIQYRSKTDDGSRIEMVKAGNGNGDIDGAYWRVTTSNGTQYYYGRDKGQGGSSADTRTGSVWTAPVYSNHPDEPGYDADFAKSRVQRAWRWNLDHVVDPSGNTMTYFYKTETGAYARERDEDKRTTYDRGGSLARIEYGSRTDAATTLRPSHRILFETADRCLGTCFNAKDEPIKKRFPDTPWDQYCREAPCTSEFSPTFWSQKRLASIRAQVYSGSADTYTDVDSWALKQTYLTAGGNESTPMWLKSITHTGEVTSAGGPAVTDPATVFNPNADVMPNRVDTPNGHSSLFRSRIDTVTTETGAQLGITYSAPECDGAVPKASSNTKRCFPQYYGAEGETPKIDWFNKYVVTRLDVYDNTGGFDHQQTNYDYLDTPAWAYDDSELIKPKKRTWSQYRGYGRVRVRQGLETGTQSSVEYRYFRGMDGDKQPKDSERPPTGTPRSVQVEDSLGTKLDDHPAYAGMLREEILYNGVGGQWVSGTLNTPARQGPTATSGDLKAWMTSTSTTRKRVRLSTGATRWTKTVTKVNDDNLPIEVDDLGDESTSSDDQCLRTEYARNSADWMLTSIKRSETVTVSCSATPARPGDVLSDSRTYYDSDTTFGSPPTRGLPVRFEELGSWNGSTPQYVTNAEVKYDALGRAVSRTDALGRATTTKYTPALTGPVTSTEITNALGQVTSTTFNPALGVPVKTLDANKGLTQMTYDGAGRLLGAWSPGRDKTKYPTDPSVSYAYKVRKNAATTVTTKTLTAYGDKTYRTSIELFDGLLRSRQSQVETIGGGRAITETVYDSRGSVEWSSNPYYDIDNSPPSTTLVTAQGRPEIPALTQNEYDGAGRQTASALVVNGDEQWRTSSTYAGEKTSTVPLNGGTATTAITDARGRQSELRQYKVASQVGSDTATTFDKTSYSYNARGELAKVVDPGGNSWVYRYDVRGNKIATDDPDSGTTTSTYDDAGQLTSTKDARGKVLAFTYDKLGRKTTERRSTQDGVKLAEWQYDSVTNGLGRLAKSIRYEYNAAGTASAYTTAITSYDIEGQALGSTLTLPSSETGLCVSAATDKCSYSQSTVYRPNGETSKVSLPAAADLPQETLTTSYYERGHAGGYSGLMSTGSQIYVQDVVYNQLDQVLRKGLGAYGNRVTLSYGYDEPTGRLARFSALPDKKTYVYNQKYDYSDFGNVTSIKDVPEGGQPAETQCFTYDYRQRLTEAWTPTSLACEAAPTKTTLGGPAPYWRSYAFDAAGNRKSETIHAGTDTTRTYTYPASGGAPGSKPHAVTSTSTVVGTAAAVTQKYAYDQSGNTTCRPTAATANVCPSTGTTDTAGQALAWNDEGSQSTSTDKSGATSYVYDADGNRLIRRDPTGATLYLPGGQEVRKPTSGAATGTRYYSHDGATVAVRTVAGLTWMLSDHHGTSTASVLATTLAVTRKRSLPFGEDRGTVPTTWPGDKGFLGGTKDNTGLTHLGAREYDPKLGRFISVDPVMDLAKPDQWNGYSYANDNPVTLSDPSGLNPCTGDDGPQCGAGPDRKANDSGNGGGNSIGGGGSTPPSGNTPNKPPVSHPSQGVSDQSSGNSAVAPPVAYVAPPVWEGPPPSNPFMSLLKGAGSVAGAVVGFDDAKDCVTTGDVSGCLWTASNFVPGLGQGKWIFGAVKGGRKGVQLVKAAERAEDGLAVGFKAAPSCPHSFAGVTLVLMADGSREQIQDVAIGDKVLATDPETGESGSRAVLAVIVNQDSELTDLTVRDDNGDSAVIHTTPTHPFWNRSSQTWTDADDLDPGQQLSSLGGRTSTVERVSTFGGSATMYNLTVDDLHTYYVLAGSTPTLVHNCGGGAVDLDNLLDRTTEMHELLHPVAQRYRTTGILHADGVGGGIDLSAVGASSNLTRLQRANSLDAGEMAISIAGRGIHTEVKLVTAARHIGVNPGGIAVSRPFCSSCSQFLTGQGATITSNRSALWLPPGAR